MTSKSGAMVAAAIFLISTTACIPQGLAQSLAANLPVGTNAAGAAPYATDFTASRHHRHHRWHYSYGGSHRTYPYDGYRPYPPPVFYCPYFEPARCYGPPPVWRWDFWNFWPS